MKFAGLIIALLLSTQASFALDGMAELSKLENRFFHHDFNGQDLNQRVARLEKDVFGEAMSGSVDERLARLLNSVPAAVASTTTVSEATPAPVNEAPVNDVPVNDVPVNDEDCAIQRAQVTIKAESEKETTKLLAEAVKHFRDGKLIESRDCFEQVIQIDPSNADANFSLGIIDEGSGNLAEALSSYRKALTARPDKAEYQDAVSALQEKMKKYAGLDSRRVQIRSLSSAAMRAYMKGEYQTALNLYLALEEKAPDQAIVKSNLATVYIALHEPEKAVECYEQAVKLNPYDDRFKQGLSHAKNLLAEAPLQKTGSSLEDKLDAIDKPEADSSFQNLGLRSSSTSTAQARSGNY